VKKFSLVDRIRYRVDNLFARGTVALILALTLVSAVFIVAVSVVVVATGIGADEGAPGPDLFEMMWRSLLRTLDPGTMGGDVGSPAFLGASLLVTFFGIFVLSILIGLLTSGIERQLESLRRGRSPVVEREHIVVLGWSAQVFSILNELLEANASRRDACIVVMADRDKPDMEEQIAARVPPKGHTRIVCRTGNPMDMTDLEIANADDARAVILLSAETDDPDMGVIKSLLALVNRTAPPRVVAAIANTQNLEAARLVAGEHAQLVLESDLVSRIMVQTCRQSGLSVVYSELLNFAGDEIYFRRDPALANRTFGEARLAYEKAAVMGIFRAGGGAQLNPPADAPLAPGDALVVIAEDDSASVAAELTPRAIAPGTMVEKRSRAPVPEHTLVLGWNHRGLNVLRQLDAYAAEQSSVLIVAAHDMAEALIAAEQPNLARLQVAFRAGDTANRGTLDALDVPSFSHVMVLSYADTMGAQEADAKTLVTLLHLRDIRERSGKSFSVVSEMLDLRNRQLAEVAHADDYIVSGHLVSVLMAQLAENPDLAPVFDDLFDPAGTEIYLKPAGDYVTLGRALDFYTVVASAERHHETAIGYRLARHAGDAARSYGVVLNPRKSEPVTFDPGDKVIVLAES
jgi:voltage-gated potassium channel Kch